MNLSFKSHGTFGILRVDDSRIDASVAIAFKDRFRDLVSGSSGDVILDLAKVDFLDSSGLGALVAARKLLGAGRVLELAGLTPAVDKVMTLTRMTTVFPIHPDAQAAVAARNAQPSATP
ncbi:STAS domain-containing protein [uncultured Roseicyclus sp.]|jgi:anti-sigma B factor antagonist|uniref:STAS domain-containing protein n=1 Tax=uncultured Roseicyclus sp. TaxID=543072 RepID=UPI00262FC9E1|nr:STAS domain-containing protein [uncultured Roseicyclus sp.]